MVTLSLVSNPVADSIPAIPTAIRSSLRLLMSYSGVSGFQKCYAVRMPYETFSPYHSNIFNPL